MVSVRGSRKIFAVSRDTRQPRTSPPIGAGATEPRGCPSASDGRPSGRTCWLRFACPPSLPAWRTQSESLGTRATSGVAQLMFGSSPMATSRPLFRDSALCGEAPVFASEPSVCPNEAHRLKSAPSVAARSAARSDSRIRPCVESWPRRCRRSISARPGATCERFQCNPVHVELPRALPADRPCSAALSLLPAPVVSPRFLRLQGSVNDFALWLRTPHSAIPHSRPV